MSLPYQQVYNSAKRAKLYGVENTLSLATWKRVLERSNGYCCYCGINVGVNKLTLEHLVPLSRGGANAEHNVAAACQSCNQTKGNRDRPRQLPDDAKRARQLRELVGLSRVAVAKLFDVRPYVVESWERGERSIPSHLPLALESIERQQGKPPNVKTAKEAILKGAKKSSKK